MTQALVKPLPPALVKVKVEGQKLLTPLQRDVAELAIESDEDYGIADTLLGDIKRARLDWSRKISPVITPLKEAVAKLKESMAGAVALDKEVDGPLEQLYENVRRKMADYQRRDALAKQELAESKRLEQERVNQQIEETTQRELATPSKALRAKLATRREALVEEAQQLDEVVTTPVKGTSSVARTVKTWRLAGTEREKRPTEEQFRAILKAILAGKIPATVVMMDYPAINKTFLAKPQTVGEWPGFELFDDIIVAGR